MKSLSDLDAKLEHRTPISSLPYTINSPGSYYVTTNLTCTPTLNGITITSGNVTLDLGGFSLVGIPSSHYGIQCVGTLTNITIANGIVTQCAYTGIDASTSATVFDLTLSHLKVSGGSSLGITVQGSSLVEDCMVQGNSLTGITVVNGTVSHCRADGNASIGISVTGGKIIDCETISNYQSGIDAYGAGSEIRGNECYHNNWSGFSGAGGLYVNGSNNRIEDNHIVANGVCGIGIPGGYTNNIIIRNSVSGNTNVLANNYVIPVNNIVGPFISQYGTITNYNAWANFSY